MRLTPWFAANRDALMARSTPFVLATGYDPSAIAPHYRSLPRCEPVKAINIARLLFG